MNNGVMSTETIGDHDVRQKSVPRRHALYLLPVAGFAGLAAALGWGLTRKPRDIPSALISKSVPEFKLGLSQLTPLGV